jgi:hypothetical protein
MYLFLVVGQFRQNRDQAISIFLPLWKGIGLDSELSVGKTSPKLIKTQLLRYKHQFPTHIARKGVSINTFENNY